MEFLQFWDQHRGSFSRISAAGWSLSYAPANRSWSGSFQNLGFGALVSRNCRTLSQIDSPRLLVWIDVIDLSQQSNEFLHFRFFTNSFILHHSSSIIYHLIIYQASALIYHVIHHLSPSIYHLPCIMYTSAFISHPFAPSPQASGVIPELSALGPRPSALSPQPSPHPSSLTPSLLNPYISPIALHMPSAAESKINNEIWFWLWLWLFDISYDHHHYYIIVAP